VKYRRIAKKKVPTNDTGTAIAGIIVDRQSPRKEIQLIQPR
jgi:hypothetical protein